MTAKIAHTEETFEALIVSEMTVDGSWITGDPHGYDPTLGLYPEDVLAFVKQTQPKKWARLVGLAGGEKPAETSLTKRLASQLDKIGAVTVLRDGISERGVNLSLCQLKPAHSIDPETSERYAQNRLRVVRQVRYDPDSGNALDLVLFVNGTPTATAELKNRWTGQTYREALHQYRHDRDPTNVLFARRAFVHFALDAEEAYMTTRLSGESTRFLPFNQGSHGAGQPGGAGNPGDPDGHPTSYVWRQLWDRDRWLELIQGFVHVEAGPKGGRASIVFPRFHQWDVVLECHAHARVHGPGQSYLIQHSAGSGKTKEIAWLAHDLSTLHTDEDEKVFSKVIVITDRRVLDRQMRDQIRQFEQTAGVFRSVTDSSSELLEALRSHEAQIVSTTIQKFPFVLEKLDEDDDLKAKTYALIVDEAHSSQSGEAATDLKELLGSRTVDDLDLDEDDGTPAALLARLAARGRQPNLSFFAFTATPKGKTLELFGTKRPDGRPAAFHTYSMRQAIEEGFIVDVLKNYTTYEQLYRLESAAGEQLEVPSSEAARRLAQFAQLHPYVKAQKAKVVIDHYKRVVRPLLGGHAKAMVVCESREEAVQWKRALDQEIERHGHSDVKALVAFSGEVTVRNSQADNVGMTYTEPAMNAIDGKPLPETKLPDEFKKPAYGILIVAEKYQTGFDQPLLSGMYVDKTLTGVNAVQTLSRLNRAHPGKENVYVLDFRNTAEHIRDAFLPFYERTEATPTDPNVLFDAADQVRGFAVISDDDLAAFADAYTTLAGLAPEKQHALLSKLTQAAFDRAGELDADGRRELRDALDRFIRFYGFLAQALAWVPPDTELLYQFSHALLPRLRDSGAGGGQVDLTGAIVLTHHRLEQLATEHIELDADEAKPLTATAGDGTGKTSGQGEIPMGMLGELVELFNERYGKELSDADALRVLTDVRDNVAAANPQLVDQAGANTREDFIANRDAMLIDAAMDTGSDRDRQGEVLKAFLDDDDFRKRAGSLIFGSIYDKMANTSF
ncbi:type I restriction endonuclease subunit R [Conexibacter sp. DBS9H8]|uniref:type I restriction endonuclease subunit R n=1 Tax=Conexibacter sp. DBS9H8 TaxID=2937801 RepID=UPI00200BD9DC|nr:type I restriction endonuclease [Conexibacter sp. DBS9H8]